MTTGEGGRTRTERPAPGGRLTPGARKILDAAAALFYARGITAVGVDLIAKESGVTKKTLYDRFGSKEALVAAYLTERDARWRVWLTEWVEGGADTAPSARVLSTFDGLGEWMRRNNARGCGFVNAAAELPDPAHPGHQAVVGQKRWLHAYLRELCAATGARDPDGLADEMALLHEGATVLQGLGTVHDAVATARSLARAALDRAAGVRE